ncbi:hypothetical protein [uncultured Thiodictyon sp.]|uniref:hypothetical protein n=1 Tax=uncultured Thiodictyon sp. TaxID=1846217 RepID=UPI0025CE348B|nr:hypothetical protein [uncultured Thiodictyon sp.]
MRPRSVVVVVVVVVEIIVAPRFSRTPKCIASPITITITTTTTTTTTTALDSARRQAA